MVFVAQKLSKKCSLKACHFFVITVVYTKLGRHYTVTFNKPMTNLYFELEVSTIKIGYRRRLQHIMMSVNYANVAFTIWYLRLQIGQIGLLPSKIYTNMEG